MLETWFTDESQSLVPASIGSTCTGTLDDAPPPGQSQAPRRSARLLAKQARKMEVTRQFACLAARRARRVEPEAGSPESLLNKRKRKCVRAPSSSSESPKRAARRERSPVPQQESPPEAPCTGTELTTTTGGEQEVEAELAKAAAMRTTKAPPTTHLKISKRLVRERRGKEPPNPPEGVLQQAAHDAFVQPRRSARLLAKQARKMEVTRQFACLAARKARRVEPEAGSPESLLDVIALKQWQKLKDNFFCNASY
ncbi:hypothetical protein HPB52_008599 [Rhipicephalus sanguineus]|uniref:Uncharacterized protein n=1 Tax=Rhipicephalus sanguineus TaxID=34632 RepID=A0A9D4SSC3_RHISA|nr:hypothetical protein HPB52_008599 [Rhipicephalus sanguineus]